VAVRKDDIIDGKYRVRRLIGEGGMGAVYEGVNISLEKRVAIKIMHADIARDRELVARFVREAKAAAQIDSRHIIDVLDLGDLGNGDRYMVMEFLEGESLSERLKRRIRLGSHEIAPLAIQLLEGLAKVHEAAILHRDLKPANIFLAKNEGGGEVVKLLDFGICKMINQAKKDRGSGEVSTAVGNLMGTLPYMAPEHIEHGPKKLDARSDLYSVGVILYRAVAGKTLYNAPHIAGLIAQMRAGHAVHLRDAVPDVDPAFAEIVDKAVAWDPNARYQTARDLATALLEWSSEPDRIKRILAEFLEKGLPEPVPDTNDYDDETREYVKQESAALIEAAHQLSDEDVEIMVEHVTDKELGIDVEIELDDDAVTIPKRTRDR
jgi:eukaryotic-like serine/threonine-protein kinase